MLRYVESKKDSQNGIMMMPLSFLKMSDEYMKLFYLSVVVSYLDRGTRTLPSQKIRIGRLFCMRPRSSGVPLSRDGLPSSRGFQQNRYQNKEP